jgi:hypothetical protein
MKTQKKPAIKLNLLVGLAFIKPRICSVDWRTVQGWFIVVLFSILAGCASAPRTIPFQNTTHRQVYSLDEGDLRKVQFYISTDVVAQHQDAQGTKAFLVPRMTPGVVTAAGPNWIKVSFREGGVDVPFITDLKQNDGRYWIATEIEGSKDLRRLTERPGRVFLYKGTPLNVVSGADAYLLVDWESWRQVVETRKVTEGRRVGDK